MRKAVAVATILAVLFALACGGRDPALDTCPTPAANELALVEKAAPVPESEVSLTIWYGARILEDEYVDEVSRLKLLEAAWAGVRAQLRKRDIHVPAEIEPERPMSQSNRDRESQLRTAFEKLPAAMSGKLSPQEILDLALHEMVDSLNDQHSYYLARSSWADELHNSVTSFGFYAQPFGEGLLITEVLPGSFAEVSGMLRGDLITALNGQALVTGRYTGAQFRAGETASFTFRRKGGEVRQLELPLKPVPLPAVKHELLNDQIGFMRLYTFPSSPDCDFIAAFQSSIDTAIADLKRQGARAWLLDLRENPGGAIYTAALMAGTLGFDGLLADIRGRGGSREPVETTGTSILGGGPLAILVNERSASSSEVLASALQESRRAQIVGQATAGEVAAAVPFPIAGGAMMITVGRVDVGPAHRTLQNTGVRPDIRVDLDLALLASQGQDSQIDAAVEYLKSKRR